MSSALPRDGLVMNRLPQSYAWTGRGVCGPKHSTARHGTAQHSTHLLGLLLRQPLQLSQDALPHRLLLSFLRDCRPGVTAAARERKRVRD